MVRSGDSVVLVTACSNEDPKPGTSFFPLTVDYREYTYAAGKFPGGFIKREGRLSEKEVLTSRLIDRPVRPLFPEGYSNESQIIAMVLSADPERDPSMLAIIGAGAALAISDIPLPPCAGAACASACINGGLVANPSYDETTKDSKLNIVVAGTEEGIVMVEAGATEATEAEVLDAIEFGHDCCKKIAAGIRELVKLAGKTKRVFTPAPVNEAIGTQIANAVRAELTDALDTQEISKLESYHRSQRSQEEGGGDRSPRRDRPKPPRNSSSSLKERIFRDEMLKAHRRPDGRKFDEIRNIDNRSRRAAPHPRLGAVYARRNAGAGHRHARHQGRRTAHRDVRPTETSKRFMLHYNFPPFSVGEVGFMRGPGRREIGHGALAERALPPCIPDENDFPYTLRVVSDILESNGSSSMATRLRRHAGPDGCRRADQGAGGGHRHGSGEGRRRVRHPHRYRRRRRSLRRHGLQGRRHQGRNHRASRWTSRCRTLPEDHAEALAQAQPGRLYILGKMLETIDTPRAEISQLRAAHLHASRSRPTRFAN